MDIRFELFLRERIGLIDGDQFPALYHDAKEYFPKAREIGELTDIFLSCGIEPHKYFEYAIPTDYAFSSKNIVSIDIPNTVERINSDAFNLSSLESISFENNSRLTSIGMFAFAHCNNLREIRLPDSLEVISPAAFKSCENLQDVYVGKNILRLTGEDIFRDCPNVVIHCYENTKMHKYVVDQKLNFILEK